MSQTVLLLIVFAFVIGHGSFLVITLLTGFHKKANRLLGFILILLMIRVGKSTLTLLIPEWSYLASAIGLVAMTATGPMLFFYIESLFVSSFEWKSKNGFHFFPAVISLVASCTMDWHILSLAYYIFTLYFLGYVFYASFLMYKNANTYRSDDVKWKWGWGIIYGISLISITFILQLFLYDRFIYGVVVVTSGIVLYCLSLWAVRQTKLFLPDPRKKNEDSDDLNELSVRILELFERDEIFIDPNLNITKLAKQLNSYPYLVSKAINNRFRKSFPEFLTTYRILRAEQLLISSLNKTFTIEAVAYESGFSTLSAFYTSFKKINKMTPSQFRKRGGKANMKVS